MLCRCLIAVFVPLALVVACGCGSSGAEGPKVENPNLKTKPIKTGKVGESGGSIPKTVD